MRKAAFSFVLIVAGLLSVFAEDLPKKAAENPLDLAFYLATKTDRRKAEKVATAFFEVGRFDDAARSIELLDNDYTKINWFAEHAVILAEQKNAAKAEQFVDKALAIITSEDEIIHKSTAINLARLLIKFNRNDEAARMFEKTDFEDAARIGIAREFLKAGQTTEALKLLPLISKVEDDAHKAEIIELFARLKQTERAERMLDVFEPTAFVNTPDYHNQRFILFPIVRANLALGKTDHAVEFWEQYGEKDDGYGWTTFIESLIEFEQREKANVYLAQIAADSEMRKSDGGTIIMLYLKLGNIEKAQNFARTMNEEFDSYEQQRGLMLLADHLIANGKTADAAEILDFAFRRAAQIEFRHEDLQSSSPGTKKRLHLHDVYRRFMRIGQFPKALAAINAIGSEHWIAKEFVMESLYDFLKQRAKNLPRRETETLLAQMQNSLTERNDDYYKPQAKLFTAEIYALLGEKAKATDLLGKAIVEGRESCCYEFEFLLRAGKIFEQFKLKPNANLKKILGDF